MKTILKLFCIITLVIIIGFTFITCNDSVDNNNGVSYQPPSGGNNNGGNNNDDNNQTPVASDYEIGNLNQTENNVTAVTISVKKDKSPGTINNIRYNNSTMIPQTTGTFDVTFDVAAATGWNAASGLSAGTLTVYELIIFTSAAELGNWLATLPVNTATSPYTVVLNTSNLDGIASILRANNTKYVNLDISGSTLTAIASYTFEECKNLTEINLPNNLTNIGSQVFYNCNNLTNITIPSSVISIDNNTFSGCGQSAYITWYYNPALKYTKYTGPFYDDYWDNIKGFQKLLVNVIIPNNITSIEDDAFSYFTSLTSVTIPNTVTSIGKYAFYNCTSLISITIPNTVTSIGEAAFYNCSKLPSITLPNKLSSMGWGVFYDCYKLTSITIPDSLTYIPGDAFSYCGITSITIPNTVTGIGSGAFEGTSLTSITIPNSITRIESYTFRCPLTSVIIPNSVTYIGDCAFSGSFTSVTIPASVTEIFDDAFGGCNNITSVTFEGTNTSLTGYRQGGFYGDLPSKYLAGGKGTYIRESGSSRWLKQ